MATRNELRAKIFSSEGMRRTSYPVKFFGGDIELRQPSVGQLARYQGGDKSTGFIGLVDILIDFAYIPGTDEKVFEEADRDQLNMLPHNDDMKAISDILPKLVGVEIEAELKN